MNVLIGLSIKLARAMFVHVLALMIHMLSQIYVLCQKTVGLGTLTKFFFSYAVSETLKITKNIRQIHNSSSSEMTIF